MNEFERRLLDVVQQSAWIASVARPNQKILDIEYYNYNTFIGAVGVAAQDQSVIQVQSDSDFAITYMSGAVVVGGVAIATPIATLQITDTGTGKTFFSAPTLFSLVMGNAGLPFYLPAPRVVAPNTNLQFNFNNIAAGGAADVYINMLGARIYYG